MVAEHLGFCQVEHSSALIILCTADDTFDGSGHPDQCLGSFCSITYNEYVIFVIQVNLLGGDVHRDGHGVHTPQIPLTGMGA